MKLTKLNTDLVECITPDTYGNGFQYRIADDMWDDFKQVMVDKAERYLNDALAETDFKDAELTIGEFISPTEYNFMTDCIQFDLEFDDSLINKIRQTVDDKFFEWAREKYKSRDGFISFMPYGKTDFMDALYLKEDSIELIRAVSMYLTYQMKDFAQDYQQDYINEVWDYATDNGYTEEEEY